MDKRKEALPIWHFSIDGRYGRTNFVNATVVIFFASVAAYIFLADLSKWAPVLIYLFFVVFYIRAVILRMHDIGFPKLGALPLTLIYLLYIPNMFIEDIRAYIVFVGVVTAAFAALALFPGTKGENQYGPHPTSGHAMGVIATIIVAAVVLIMLVLSEIPME